MPSIVDMIAKAEAEAENIRFEASAKAKEIIAECAEECERAEKNARAEVLHMFEVREENAENTAKKLTQDILASRANESQNNCRIAEKNLDKAVKYIIERVTVS